MRTKTNAHTHLDTTLSNSLCPSRPMSFPRWVLRAGVRLGRRSDAECVASVKRGLALLQAAGTTHIGDISAKWQGIEAIQDSGLRGVVFLEVMGLTERGSLARLEEAVSTIERLSRGSSGLAIGLSLHAPYSCHHALLERGATWCAQSKTPLAIHVAESPLEVALLAGQRYGPIPLPWLRPIYRAFPRRRAPGCTPVTYLERLGVLEARPLLIHAVHVTPEEVRLLARRGCAVVHCPRSNHLLSCGRMPLEKYLEAGVSVYLGTDGLSSSPTLDVADDVRYAQVLHAGRVGPEVIAALAKRPLTIPAPRAMLHSADHKPQEEDRRCRDSDSARAPFRGGR